MWYPYTILGIVVECKHIYKRVHENAVWIVYQPVFNSCVVQELTTCNWITIFSHMRGAAG